ncbi:galactose-1-phosphate uridylyltransferase [Thermosipho sp. 1063]|uniref:galactose-1-phosphate uridylyltransferase n=1 Tax=unclassified Thermosipho (in: thermotogales) TaxID=2676525 RepID=UPI0009493196|nr:MULTISPECIES: galactose-1-phosphate uridylyltransferase [unclassified Thermosipho (in: thermotogales)]ANQ53212.1 galactose-1-phosphate uridylyltransferase [Thermosipho sp. 1070]APT71662.1 galactose-1-phosphate uridylyltransferase [Thermosipho sp. 1063]OOC45179.1 galactose-1-phosphate uridylyltransferase [Thermosipho sp. 1074]
MPEYRKDPVVRRWVIIATERAKRPHDFSVPKEEKKDGFCPFDYGNEHTTPPEMLAFRPDDSEPNSPGWWVRVVPNKFPAVNPNIEVQKYGHGMYDAMTGFGYHEVIIETPDHNSTFALYDDKQAQEVVWAYVKRYNEIEKDERIKYILIFRNHGALGGASLPHPHSQIIAIPSIPKRVLEEMNGSKDYYDYKERCVFCDMISQEKIENRRIIEENEHFIAFAPYASRFPFEIWIIPKEHAHNFGAISEEQIPTFARILRNSLYRIYKVLDNPPYNFVIHTSPTYEEGKIYYHWHVEIMPRLTRVAGFEWGSGFYINPVPPEDAAKYLRNVEI